MRAWLVVVVVSPLLVLLLLLARPAIDRSWENHPAHFWLVLGAAALATALGWTVSVAARRRRDARLLLISLAFIASSGFFALHALATPGVLLAGPNAGFELATPVGLVIAGMFAAASAIELRPAQARLVVRSAERPPRRPLRGHGRLGLRRADGAAPARRPARRGAARRVAARPGRGRRRALRAGGDRLRASLPAATRAVRLRVHARVRAPGGGDDRDRLGPQLAGVLVGVAHPDAGRVRAHRPHGADRVARGAVQRALPRRDAGRRPRRERRPRRPRGLHELLGAARPGRGRRHVERVLRAHRPAHGAGGRRGPSDRR